MTEDRDLDRAFDALRHRLDDDIARSGALERISAGVAARITDRSVREYVAMGLPPARAMRPHRPSHARMAAALIAACLAGVIVGIVLPPPEEIGDSAVASLDTLTFGPLEGIEP